MSKKENEQFTREILDAISKMGNGGAVDIPAGGVATVEVAPILSTLLNLIISPMELNIQTANHIDTETMEHYRKAIQRSKMPVTAFGKSLLDAGNIMEIISQYVTEGVGNTPENENNTRKLQLVVLSDMLTTFHYLKHNIENATTNGEGHMASATRDRVSIDIAGEHILHIHLFIMSVMVGIRTNHLSGLDAASLDKLVEQLRREGSVKTNNPVEMLILYFLDITAQYTQKVGKITLSSEDLKSTLREDHSIDIQKLRDIISKSTVTPME